MIIIKLINYCKSHSEYCDPSNSKKIKACINAGYGARILLVVWQKNSYKLIRIYLMVGGFGIAQRKLAAIK